MGQAGDGEEFVFNGIDGAGGGYLLPALAPAAVAALALGERADPAHLAELTARHRRASTGRRGVGWGVDPTKLEETGWGVVFAHGADPAIAEALAPLLRRRREQATRQRADYYREFAGRTAYRPGESKGAFLARQGMGPGPAVPGVVPYYLLLVGGPEAIPYRVQYELDVQYAVGRLAFDTPEEYARYAESVLATEGVSRPRARRAVLFGTRNPDDRATQLSADELVGPLAAELAAEQGGAPPGAGAGGGTTGARGWDVETVLGAAAHKARLARLLGGAETPALLFTAGHGVAFPPADPRRRPHQGALLCQDWPGPLTPRGPVPPDYYLAAEDVGESAALGGLVALHFACYGAGTPGADERDPGGPAGLGAPAPAADSGDPTSPFVARLPQRLLGHPRGGALAVVGHVGRAWSYSFRWAGAGAQREVFRSVLRALLAGAPVGAALEVVNARYAELAAALGAALEETRAGRAGDALELAALWTATNDARGFVLLGDPAVRVPAAA